MARTFDLITTCMGRLEHLKRSLPSMLGQGAANVIVVDYSCPEAAGEYVREHFPAVRVVSIPDQQHFSNWKARNAGAAVATSQLLVFCDADTILADGAIERLSAHLPPKALGHFDRRDRRTFNKARFDLADNQLAGFLVVPRAAFFSVGGYDEVLEGYGAGGDTDLTYRLGVAGLKLHPLDPRIVERVLEHDDCDRARHHADSMAHSFAAGLIYRSAKRYLMAIRNRLELDLELRKSLYETARAAAQKLDASDNRAGITVALEKSPILMAPLLGHDRGTQTISLKIDLSFGDEAPNAAAKQRKRPPRK